MRKFELFCKLFCNDFVNFEFFGCLSVNLVCCMSILKSANRNKNLRQSISNVSLPTSRTTIKTRTSKKPLNYSKLIFRLKFDSPKSYASHFQVSSLLPFLKKRQNHHQFYAIYMKSHIIYIKV